MYISVWRHTSNPTTDRRDYRRSLPYCESEVKSGRARQLSDADISIGIHLIAPEEVIKSDKTERRGSPESAGCLTANESLLNSQYGRKLRDGDIVRQIHQLSEQYEHTLNQHESRGKKGTPVMCSIIAAKAKALLSDPVFGRDELLRLQTLARNDGRVPIFGSVADVMSNLPASA